MDSMEDKREGENRVGFYHRFMHYVINNPVVRGIKGITMRRQLEHTVSRKDSSNTKVNIDYVNGSDQNSSHVAAGGFASSTPSPPVLKKGSAIVGGRRTQVQKGVPSPSKRIGGWFL